VSWSRVAEFARAVFAGGESKTLAPKKKAATKKVAAKKAVKRKISRKISRKKTRKVSRKKTPRRR